MQQLYICWQDENEEERKNNCCDKTFNRYHVVILYFIFTELKHLLKPTAKTIGIMNESSIYLALDFA